MTPIDFITRFESKVLAFYRMTGKLAPGKDAPAANPHVAATLEQWDEWNATHGAAVENTIAACWEIFGEHSE